MPTKSVFQVLCNHYADFMITFGYPIQRKVIQDELGLSKYQALKELRNLREKGLVRLVRINYYDDYDCENHLLIGYAVTNLGKKTNEYKIAYEDVRRRIKQHFGMDIGGLDDSSNCEV